MGVSEVKVPLLDGDDCEIQSHERMSRGEGDRIAMPHPSVIEGTGSDTVEGSVFRWNSRTGVVLVSICCIAAVMAIGFAFVPCDVKIRSGGGLLDKIAAAFDKDDEFFIESVTSYHFRSEKNFIADPDAPLYYKGYYHFFYQYNPYASIWGNITWGHAVSKDLIHWTYLDVMLEPDEWYDYEGTWSGSATILKDGSPVILYTGGRGAFGGEANQSTNMALPIDPADPLLREWSKVDLNPIMYNPSFIEANEFRDPTTAWLEDDGKWRLVLGSRRTNPDGTKDGIAMMYTSSDFMAWNLSETVLHRVKNTGMWECVDLFPILKESQIGVNHSTAMKYAAEHPEHYYSGPYKYVLKVSLDDSRKDYYTIGQYSTETHKFTPDDPAIDAGIGFRYDYGKFYASKSFYDPVYKRRVLWGYVNESDSIEDDLIKGWSCIQAIPRTVFLDPMIPNYVLQWPVFELDAIRGAKDVMRDITLQPTDVVKVPGSVGMQLDIMVVFEKPNVSSVPEVPPTPHRFDCFRGTAADRGVFGPFGLLVNADKNLVEQTAVFFYISHKPGSGGDGWTYQACNDQSKSSLAPDLDMAGFGSKLIVLEEENELHMRILVDHSVVETFVQNGRFVITSRVYPTIALKSKAQAFLFNNGTTPIKMKRLDVFQMNTVKMTDGRTRNLV